MQWNDQSCLQPSQVTPLSQAVEILIESILRNQIDFTKSVIISRSIYTDIK